MKLEQHFRNFMRDTVNLNKSRLIDLQARVQNISSFIQSNQTFGPIVQSIEQQGSWAHGTIIKPSPKQPEFDADVLLYIDGQEGWEATEYIDRLYREFRADGRYREKTHRGTRCVTIDYTGETHIDLVPVLRVDQGHLFYDWHEYVINRITNQLEETNPKGFLSWFANLNKFSNGQLAKVIRLIKYLRDIKKTFSCKSILLTTLLTSQVHDGFFMSDDPEMDYPDIPTALTTILSRLDTYLQENTQMPHITNPSLDSEDFIRHWDEKTYSNFRSKIHFYTDRILSAFNDEDSEESIIKWREILGDDFAASIKVERRMLTPSAFFNVSHRKLMPWLDKSVDHVVLRAFYMNKQKKVTPFRSNSRPLPKGRELKFSYQTDVPLPYKVFWQVVNTGSEALRDGDLRGDIFEEDDGQQHIESSKYKGRHWIECFIVKGEICVARSTPFIVNIQ
ncbi:MAG: hypothetical protein K8S14_06515 [Actinomycetia bacterium]|nr:hypothetical protein [Actinomycetes bacterium]